MAPEKKITHPHNIYEIRFEGQLTGSWSDWFAGLASHSEHTGETILHGSLEDQSALLGVLGRIHALNLTLISVRRLPSE